MAVTAVPVDRRWRPDTHKMKVIALRLAALGALYGAWLYAIGPGDISPLILPEPGKVVEAIWGFLRSAELYAAIRVTMFAILTSLVLASVFGFLIGFWGARTPRRASVVEPLLVWGYLVPHILFYPLLVLWFGVGVSSKIAYSATSAVLPIAFNCLRAFRTVDAKYVNVGRAFGASPHQLDLLIKLRAGIPMAAAGLRLGAALAMITVVVAEMLSSTQGLGYMLKLYSQSFATAKALALTFIIVGVVGIFLLIIDRVLPKPMEKGR